MALKKFGLWLTVDGKEQRVGCRWRKEGTPPGIIHKELVDLGYDPAIVVREEEDAPAPVPVEVTAPAVVEEDYSNL
ncbi:MAG: hypothetical protein WC551_10415 [Patescibacteria group bacterium]